MVQQQQEITIPRWLASFIQKVAKEHRLAGWKVKTWEVEREAWCCTSRNIICIPVTPSKFETKIFFLHEVAHALDFRRRGHSEHDEYFMGIQQRLLQRYFKQDWQVAHDIALEFAWYR